MFICKDRSSGAVVFIDFFAIFYIFVLVAFVRTLSLDSVSDHCRRTPNPCGRGNAIF
jgi:hypothetical protein